MATDAKKMKIVFMGTSSFASVILEGLLREKYNVISVYTKPDAKSGRKQEISSSAVKKTAEKAELKIFCPEKLNEDTAIDIKSSDPDLIIVVAYGKILPSQILDIPKFGAINVHASLLPKFRGPSPIQNALLCGEKETGITIMLMDEGIDTGEIISQEKLAIGDDELLPELSGRLSKLGLDMMLQTIPQLVEKKITPLKQDNSSSTICQLIEKNDGKINWSEEAQEIYNRYRAFQPWPGIYSFLEKNGRYLRLKFNKISFSPSFGSPERLHIGEVFLKDDKVAVQTGKGAIILEELQLEGKNKISVVDFLRGFPEFIGSVMK